MSTAVTTIATANKPAVNTIFSAGDRLNTGNQLDTAIDGLGFFQVQRPNGDLVFTDDLRNGVIGSNLVLETTGTGGVLDLALTDFRPGISDYAFESLTDFDNANNPAIDLTSFEATGFDQILVPAFAPTRTTDNASGATETTTIDFGAFPIPGVAKTPLVSGQWVAGDDYPLELAVNINSQLPGVAVDGDIAPMGG